MKKDKILVVLIVIFFIGTLFFAYKFLSSQNNNDSLSKQIEKTTEEIQETIKYKPKVFAFGCDVRNGDTYCIIPESSDVPYDSICLWYYEAGTGQIPYHETTETNHFIKIMGTPYNFKVSCIDYYSNLYFGEEN